MSSLEIVPIVLNDNYGGFFIPDGVALEVSCEDRDSIKVRTNPTLVEYVSSGDYKGDLIIEKIPKHIFDATMMFHTPNSTIWTTKFFRINEYDGCESLEVHSDTFGYFKYQQDTEEKERTVKAILSSEELTDAEKLNAIATVYEEESDQADLTLAREKDCVRIQALVRGFLARKAYRELLKRIEEDYKKAVRIQRLCSSRSEDDFKAKCRAAAEGDHLLSLREKYAFVLTFNRTFTLF